MPALLPSNIEDRYRAATDAEIRAESFGVLSAARINVDGDWHAQRGTFDDQACFGPKRPFACACGKYAGEPAEGILCDRCGVMVATLDVRRSRCAHLKLPAPQIHPVDAASDALTILPVAPVSFVLAPGGMSLLSAYDEILKARDADAAHRGFIRVLELFAPLIIAADQWDLEHHELIAHCMALKRRG